MSIYGTLNKTTENKENAAPVTNTEEKLKDIHVSGFDEVDIENK